MKKIYTLPFLALLFLPFCANRKPEQKPVSISSAEVSLSVELDVLRFACERRLKALEAQAYTPKEKAPQTQSIRAVKASDPVNE